MAERPFTYDPDPENPGWKIWQMVVPGLYNDFLGKIIMRKDADQASARMLPQIQHSNPNGIMHGGAMLGFIDVSLFTAMQILCEHPPETAATIDLQTQFTGAVKLDQHIESHTLITKETGNLLFMRGTVEQAGQSVAAYTGLIKKVRTSKKTPSSPVLP